MNAQRALRDLAHTPNGQLFFTSGAVQLADVGAQTLNRPTSELLPGGSIAAAHRIWGAQGPDFSTDTLVWADAGFCDLLEAAAIGLREQAVADGVFRSEEFDLLAPSGTLYLSRPIDLVRRHHADPRTYRRLDWSIDNGQILKVGAIGDRPEDRGRAYQLGTPAWTLGSIKGVGYAWTAPAITPIGTAMPVPVGDDLSNYHSTFLVLALASLVRSKHVLDEPTSPHVPSTGSSTAGPASRNEGDTSGLRRISLTRPEIGAMELHAARPGASRRAHWVRGHWRRQWYATVEEHRMRWVDGHLRGDPAHGMVAGDRVLIARTPKGAPA